MSQPDAPAPPPPEEPMMQGEDVPEESKAFKCTSTDCNRNFNRADNLRRHMRVHTGEKPYACSWPGCDKRFAQSGAAKEHLRVHTGEKPFACTFAGCGKVRAEQSPRFHILDPCLSRR
jgi:uncharacterized Zn-finger protein